MNRNLENDKRNAETFCHLWRGQGHAFASALRFVSCAPALEASRPFSVPSLTTLRFVVSVLPAQLRSSLDLGAIRSSASLAGSFFPALLGDLLLSLQTPLRFPCVDKASPDLSREN